jgi:gamma-butyrobetaine dioxygenase
MSIDAPEPVQIIADLFASDGAADFAAKPFAADACQLRRWDDEAKVPDAPTPAFGHFAPVLAGLVRPARGLENSERDH